MQIICPKCDAEYNLPDDAVGEDGRDVKCVKCSNTWHVGISDGHDIAQTLADIAEEIMDDDDANGDLEDQLPNIPAIAQLDNEFEADDNTASGALADDLPDDLSSEDRARSNLQDEPIPEGVKPREKDKEPKNAQKRQMPIPMPAKLAGYAAAFAVVAICILAGFFFKQKIVTTWPPAAIIYDLAGSPVTYKGQGLVVERLSANMLENDKDSGMQAKSDTLVIKGRVLNLTGKSIEVPQMMATLRTTNGEDTVGWIIDPPVENIAAGESFAFTSNYKAVPRGIGSVNLTFVPSL
jgi:predicted Zn finger-like uncharacterized protein